MGKTINREIIEEILYRLPVKSLLRFKCVSKSWLSLISGEDFVRRHLKKSSSNDDGFSHDSKLIFSFEYNRRCALLGLGSCSFRDDPIITPNFDSNPVNFSDFKIVGSCNGLILIDMINSLLLWNPSTREVKSILYPSFLYPSFGDQAHIRLNLLYGFGYDEPRDEYKVVCISVPSNGDLPMYQTKMFTSKTNSWKKIQDFDKGFPGHHSAKFVNGRFHWLIRGDGGRSNIVSLDLFDEKYETMTPPRCFSNSSVLNLEDLGGYLSLINITFPSSDINVWAMMEYGATESWTKIWTLSDFVDRPMRHVISGRPKPLCLKKNGDIAVAFGSDIVVYNGKNEVRRSRVDTIDRKVDTIVYVESLVGFTIWRR